MIHHALRRLRQHGGDRFLEFYPDAGDVLYWDHLTEELHRAQGGKWQNTRYRHAEP